MRYCIPRKTLEQLLYLSKLRCGSFWCFLKHVFYKNNVMVVSVNDTNWYIYALCVHTSLTMTPNYIIKKTREQNIFEAIVVVSMLDVQTIVVDSCYSTVLWA